MLIEYIDKEIEYYEDKIDKVNNDCCENIKECYKCKKQYSSQWCPVNTIREYINLLNKIKIDKEEVDRILNYKEKNKINNKDIRKEVI